MKTIKQWFVFSVLGCVAGFASAQTELTSSQKHQNLLTGVADGCPSQFEDISAQIVNGTSPFWGSGTINAATDEAAFRASFIQNNEVSGVPPTQNEVDAVMADESAILFECNAHRLNLLQYLLSLNADDANASLDIISGIAGAIDLSSGRWETGDVRTTGRTAAASGWVLLDGKTIGASNSTTAFHRNDDYQALFELIKTWDPALSGQTWGASGAAGTVPLPDMRGRAAFGANTMGNSGGPSLDALAVSDASASKIGGVFGKEKSVISSAQLPTHTHGMANGGVHAHDSTALGNHTHGVNNSPSHSHSNGYAGTHGHSLRTSTFQGSGGARSDLPYFEGKARPNYQNNIPSSVQQAGNHRHSIGNGGVHAHSTVGAGGHDHAIRNSASHKHTNLNAGSSASLTTTSPGIAFYVEMKL